MSDSAIESVWVKPAPGLLVRREAAETGHVAAEGERVALTSYIRRRLADGDLVKTTKPRAARTSATAQSEGGSD